MRCFLAFVSCLRWENVLLSTIHHPNAVITTHFYVVAFRLSHEKWYLFPYSSVFYTVSRFDIYKYVIIHICFGEALFSLMKKKTTKKQKTKTKKQPHRFTRVCRFASNKLWRANHWVQLFVASKYRLRSNGGKVVNEIVIIITNQQLYSRIFVWKIKIALNISSYFWPQRRFCRRHFFSSGRTKLPHCFTHGLYVCLFLSKDHASSF